MKFREHRGGLGESLATMIEFQTRTELARHLNKIRPDLLISGAILEAKPYAGDDNRIGWKDVHILVSDKGSVIGFIDGPMPPPAPWE